MRCSAALDPTVQRSLSELSVVPSLDREIISTLLGERDAEVACDAALDVGLLVERGTRIELHPLARVFLDERTSAWESIAAPGGGVSCVSIAIAKTGTPHSSSSSAPQLTELSTHSSQQRSMTYLIQPGSRRLRRGAVWRPTRMSSRRLTRLARAEVRLRDGHLLEATAYAEMAAVSPELAFRALCIAGRAAHLASREEAGLELFHRAEEVAASRGSAADAKWGQLACSIDLEHPDAAEALDELSAGVSFADVREVVRMATHRMYLQLRTGSLQLDEADTAWQVIDAVRDPIVVTSFLSAYSIALALSARYSDASRRHKRCGEVASAPIRLCAAVCVVRNGNGLCRPAPMVERRACSNGGARASSDAPRCTCRSSQSLRPSASLRPAEPALTRSRDPDRGTARSARCLGCRGCVFASACARVRGAHR